MPVPPDWVAIAVPSQLALVIFPPFRDSPVKVGLAVAEISWPILMITPPVPLPVVVTPIPSKIEAVPP